MNDIDAKCEHVLHDNGIHEFIVKDHSSAGADAYFTHLERLYQGRTDDSPPLHSLLNTAGGTLPINYMIQRGKEVSARNPPIGINRVAILTDNQIEARLADSFMRITQFRNVRVRFFASSHRDNAIAWLLRDE